MLALGIVRDCSLTLTLFPQASVLYKIVENIALTGLFTSTCSLENVTGLFTNTSPLENVTGLSFISCTLAVNFV